MAVTKTAANCPLPIKFSTFLYLSDYLLSSAVPDMVNGLKVETGDTDIAPSWNVNAVHPDILGSYGGGVLCGVVHGLAISAGSGLTLNIAAGGAIVGAVVQVDDATTLVLSNNADNWVWLKQDGTIVGTTTTTPPVTECCLLGLAVTSAGSISSVGTDGVVYLRGMPWRETADLSVPGDTPPAVCFITKTGDGEYLWDGTAHRRLVPALETILAVTADKTETASDRYKVVTNEGTTVKPVITLESAVAGLRRLFIVQDTDGIRVKANTGDTIRVGSSVSAGAGYAECTTVGATLELVAINATEWVAVAVNGTWTVV